MTIDLTGWQLELDPALLEPLGLVTVTFTVLEDEVAFLIWSLLAETDSLRQPGDRAHALASLRHQRAGRVLTAVLSFGRKLEVAGTLVAERFGASSKQAKIARDVLKRCRDAEEARNRLVHSAWGHGSSPGTSSRAKTKTGRKGLVFTFEEVTHSELVATAKRFNDLASAVDSLRRQFYPKNSAG